jgi:hypothetical protein
LRLASGDIVGYRSQCEALLKSLPFASEKEAMTIWVCLLIPHAVTHLTRVLEQSESALAEEERRFTNRISTDSSITRNYAAALLRSGRAAEAITVLVQCTKQREGYVLPEVWMLLSLAYAQQGDDRESAVWRAKTVDTFEEQGKKLEWTDREILKVLLSEFAQSEEAK